MCAPVYNLRHGGELALLLLLGEVDQPPLPNGLALAELAKVGGATWQAHLASPEQQDLFH